jgi:hypothetical protein
VRARRAISRHASELGANHTVAGSLVRLRQGRVSIPLDDEWTSRLPPADRRLVTALTWPLLRRYGYVGASGQSPTARASGRAPGGRRGWAPGALFR